MATVNPTLRRVTAAIRTRSRELRANYLARLGSGEANQPARRTLAAANQAHAYASAGPSDRRSLRVLDAANVGIVTAYNDMLSAHQPFEGYPEQIRAAAREVGATAQVAGGVPAMCDGVTQGRAGMELSLFSRDVIAMSTAVALSHATFDAALCLGVCDKIVPGLLIGALSFGHLPVAFVPAGPMATGLSNPDKAAARVRHATGELDDAALLAMESRAYHSPGTCTFYGTANSNQMLLEAMGLMVPGAAFVGPDDALRPLLTRAAVHAVASRTALGSNYRPLAEVVDERTIVNGLVALLATGGSTNHTIHLVAIARAAGVVVDWNDFDQLSRAVPLLTRLYPNGSADVNAFHAAGGTAFLIRELLDAGLLHADIPTVWGDEGLRGYTRRPAKERDELTWSQVSESSGDPELLRAVADPFSPEGGLRLLAGNLGRSIIKISAVAPEHRNVRAPCRVFEHQGAVLDAIRAGELERDVVVVVRGQGPRARGMPELHKLTPALSALQQRGHQVALVTDGRMSGASGKIPAAIHVSPESACGGALARLRDGDVVLLDAEGGRLEVQLDDAELATRDLSAADNTGAQAGTGRELFAGMRRDVSSAETGAMSFGWPDLD